MTARRPRLAHLFVAVAAAFLITLAIGEAKAAAQGYQVWSCSNRIWEEGRGSGGDWFSNQGWIDNHCPDGLDFPSGATLGSEYYAFDWQWSSAVGPHAVLSKVALTMKGGSTAGGLVYEVAENASAPAFATLPARAAGAADLTTSVNVPAGVKTISLRARCATTTCTGSARLRVNEIKFWVDDSTAPTAEIAQPFLNSGPDGATTGQVPWFRPDSMPMDLRFREEGSGLAAATLSIDGSGTPFALRKLWTKQSACVPRWEFLADAPPAIVYTRPQICTGELSPPSIIDLRGVAEGRHRLTLDSSDAVGLASDPFVGWFGVDATPPEAPDGFQFINTAINRHGWTTSPLFAAYVANPPEDVPNAAPVIGPFAKITRDDAPGTPIEFLPYGNHVPFPSEGHFRVESWFGDDAGNRGHAAPIFVGFDTTKPPTPQPDENDWVSRHQLINDYKQTWPHIDAPANLESDICGFIVAFDTEPINTLGGEPTIEGNVDSVSVPANLPEGHNFSHVAAVSCAGRVSDTAHAPLPVDATAPQVEIDGLASGDWSSEPLNLTLKPEDELSGVALLEWSLDGGPVQTAGGPVGIEIPDGQHVLTTSATDKAGNQSESSSIVIRVDSAGPASWLAPAGGRPNDFEAHVQDSNSGLDSAALQYRRVDAAATTGERVWQQTGAAFLPPSDETGAHSFKRALDDSVLADGAYELRVIAVDQAGNVGFGSTLPAGGTVVVNLPLRVRPAVSLAVADVIRRCTSSSRRGCVSSTRCRKGARCTFRWTTTRKGAGIDRIMNWGDRAALIGSVLSPGGAPLGGVKVSIYAKSPIGERELVHIATTQSDGSFEWRIPSGTTRRFVATTAATDDLAVAESSATLAVRAGLSFAAADRTPRPGQSIRLSGRLLSGGMGVPAGGKQITIEFWDDGKWSPASIDPPFTNGSGRFALTWKIRHSATAGTLFLRAHAESLATETAWPFEAGKSRSIRFEIHR